MRLLLSYISFYFEVSLCWFGYFLYKINQGFEIDLDVRNHKTIIFCTIGVFVARIVLMFVDYEKKTIEIEQRKIDLEISKELLRAKKLKNDVEHNRQLLILNKPNY